MAKSYEIKKGQNKLEIFTTEPCLLSVNGDPVGALPAGKHNRTIRANEDKILEIDTVGKGEAKVKIQHYEMARHDQINDEAPPPPPDPSNWLKAMRWKIQQEMGITREHFTEGTSIYQMGDTETFEEELAQQHKDQSGQAVQGDSPTPDSPDPEPQEAPADSSPEQTQ